MNNKLMENILSEFEKSQDNTNEIFRIQDDLSNCESELVALQIRFVHKNKENDDLKRQLEAKNKLLAEKKSDMECNGERFSKLEFHYNELLQKHKLCLECMTRQKADYDKIVTDYDQLNDKNIKLEEDKLKVQEFLNSEIDQLGLKLTKLIAENEEYQRNFKDLRINYQAKEIELQKHLEQRELVQTKSKLVQEELDLFKMQYSRNLGSRSTTITSYEENVKKLELEVAKVTSKLDSTCLELNEMTKKYNDQLKRADMLEGTNLHKDLQYNEFKANFSKCFMKNQNLEQQLINFRAENTARVNENERNQFKKQQDMFENIVHKLTLLYNEQQKKFEALIVYSKSQTQTIKKLRSNSEKFSEKFSQFKTAYYLLKSQKNEAEKEGKLMLDRCCDLENKYAQKCDHLNNLEREVNVMRSNLDAAANDLNNLQNIVRSRDDEVLCKSQTIEKLQALINQQSNDLTKRKQELTERVNQIDLFDSHLTEEKATMELKMTHLEANLKSKSKQLHQRIEQIKDMNEIVETLKEDKEQTDHKIQKYENLIKCQKFEIESKSSMIKQSELRNKDLSHELDSIREVQKRLEVKPRQQTDQETQSGQDLVDSNTQTEIEISTSQYESGSSFSMSTTDNMSQTNELSSLESLNDKTLIDDLRLNLKIKENIIETVNDNLLLKEAEIARLKTRIGIYERKRQTNGINN